MQQTVTFIYTLFSCNKTADNEPDLDRFTLFNFSPETLTTTSLPLVFGLSIG